MQVHREISALPYFTNAVITIGSFDGVHEGHRKIIRALNEQAFQVNGESVIITFEPHPRKIVNPEKHLQLINTCDEKIELLEQTGINHLVIVQFDEKFAEQSAEEYITEFLVKKFNPHTIIIGYDHHFGKGRKGNFALLQQQSIHYNYKLLEIPKHVLDEISVSSTKIRNALLNSQVELANKLLGYTFFFEGKVVKGDQLGRKLGFPTANLEYTDRDKIHLGNGVYAVYVQIGNQHLKGMLSIGNRPTLSGSPVLVEVNIFDWNKEIYGETIRITVSAYLRKQEKYPDLKSLEIQLQRDKESSLKIL
ncbi:MAG TPA: bifunctional riboflavin kinase/FAD synthetase [Flavisolibacter sp.]|nr:bifunctional riboflavin kinase/FAD synthetase [Flavisolibacter sp.]